MDCGDWLRKRTSRLMFWAWAGRCQEELLANKLHSTQAQATQSDLILEFCEQRFHLLSLPLCVREARRVCQVSRGVAGRAHGCEWQDTSTVSWCIALFARTPHNVCGSRCRRGYGSEHCVHHS